MQAGHGSDSKNHNINIAPQPLLEFLDKILG